MSDEIAKLRERRASALQARGTCADRLADADAALVLAQRIDASKDEREALELERNSALDALKAARAEEHAALAAISEGVAALAESPIERIDALDAGYPVLFFPVRIETRFAPGPSGAAADGGQLLVRIYPDGVLVQTHEPLLTDLEVAAGEAYWQRVFDGTPEAESWTLLLGETDAQRAAWIVERTTPLNVGDISGADPPPAPQFPAQQRRPPGWHRQPEAPTLPDRWIVTTYRDGARRQRVFSAPVREGLALTVRLSGDSDDPAVDNAIDISGDGLEIEPDLLWAYDFAEAVAAGMAVRIPIEPLDLEQGFSRVLVAGVRTSGTADVQADELEALLEGHRFSRGLALVPQGAQTNNSADAPAAYPMPDPAGTESFAVARGAPLAAPGTDGYRLAAALGVAVSTADHIDGAGRDEQTRAGAMIDALWPATIGYFLSQLMAPQVEAATRDALRSYMREHVRPRGPYPAFRVGGVPYGVLPVSSLGRWQTDPKRDEPVISGLPGWLTTLARLWPQSESAPPHVGRSDDPDADLIETLGQDASAQSAQIRRTLGQDTIWNALAFTGIPFVPWRGLQRQVAAPILADIAQPEWDPRVMHLHFADDAYDFSGPLIQKQPLSESDSLVFDYIAWLRTASPDALRDQLATPTDEPLDALLYLMLRHALLTEYDNSALDVLDWRGLAVPAERMEAELVGVVPTVPPSPQPRATPAPGEVGGGRTAWERLETAVPGVSEARSLGDFLADPQSIDRAHAPQVRVILERFNDYRTRMRDLEGAPSAELERLFTETIDTSSHRLDPWITSLYTQRLQAMRAAHPRGAYVGCYGWVEHLVPDPQPELVQVSGADGQQEQAQLDTGGHVYAPSMLHAATAAVLRSAYLTRTGGGDDTYAVDLSSRRVRAAIALLDSVRDDQPLGAALGYAFERGLHEGHPGVELDQYIDAFRSLYPIVANKAEDSGEAAESVAARNVVDGLRLRAAWRAGQIQWGSDGLTPDATERAAIEQELARLDDAVDAVGDLLLAESVHQVLRGSTAGTAATLDSLAKGHRAPEPDVAATPRGGSVLHHRVALVVSAATLPAEWDAIGPTPRAAATRELNAWLASLLRPPDEIACTATPEAGGARPVTVSELALQPVDLLWHAAAVDAGAPGADLDHRVARRVAALVGDDVAVTIDYADGGGAALSIAEVLELLGEIARTVGYARDLEPRDLVAPERGSAIATADLLIAEADARADAAETELGATAQALASAASSVRAAPPGTDPDLAVLRDALARAANLGVAGAYPAGQHDNSAAVRDGLLGLVDTVAAALAERAVDVAQARSAGERLRAVFGRAFPVLARFVPADRELLAPALANEPDLGTNADATVEGWFAQLTQVREPLDSWRQVVLYSRALDARLPRPRIAQIPLEADGGLPRWAALDYDGAGPHRSGLCSLALFGDLPAVDEPWSGLLLDAWPEILPNSEEDAGVVFHFDAPGAQAPQCVLLAVPPTLAEKWSYDALEETLLETLDMARMRAIDLSNLGRYGQVLPMNYLAANARNEAIGTSFVGLVLARATIAGTEA